MAFAQFIIYTLKEIEKELQSGLAQWYLTTGEMEIPLIFSCW